MSPKAEDFPMSTDHWVVLNELEKIVTMTNFSDSLISKLPYSPSALQPCQWDTVQLSHANPSLYKFPKTNNDKIRIIVSFHEDVEVFSSHWAYSFVGMLSNVFGLVGLYLGYCFLDIYFMTEKALTALFRSVADKEQ